MFWINKTMAEEAAMIIAGYCDKQLTDWEMPEEKSQHG